MSASIRIRLSVLAGIVLATGPALGQGYVIRSTGYYEVPGSTYSYTPSQPTVVVQDSWGRPFAVPLQPKVLYYDTPFMTPQGWYRPTSIAVMSNARPPAVTMPAPYAPPAAKPPRIPSAGATFRYDSGARLGTPDTGPPPPAPMPPSATLPAPATPRKPDAGPLPPVPMPPPTVPAPATPRKPDGGALPPVPMPSRAAELPAIPTVPLLPEVPKVPNLGPASKDK
jgi:hypothetical protein